MNVVFEKTNQLKNVVKFTRLENNRNFEELQFIRNHLNKVSKTKQTNPNGQSINIDKQLKHLDTFTQRQNLNDGKGRNYTMRNGNNYSEFLSPRR